MKKLTLSTTAILALLSLTACGGGGGGGGGATPPPVDGGGNGGGPAGPASRSSADLLSFVSDGGRVVENHHTDKNGMTRIQRDGTVDGERVTVTVDRLPDGTYGLIQYVEGNNATFYTIDDTLVASTDYPDGQYNGAFDVNYSVDGGASWSVGSGDATIVINSVTGEADFGGMATAFGENGASSSVEYYSTADLVNGSFSDSGASVVYREDGSLAGNFEGSVDGMLVGTGSDAGVVGTVGGDDGVFQASGGFTATPYNP